MLNNIIRLFVVFAILIKISMCMEKVEKDNNNHSIVLTDIFKDSYINNLKSNSYYKQGMILAEQHSDYVAQINFDKAFKITLEQLIAELEMEMERLAREADEIANDKIKAEHRIKIAKIRLTIESFKLAAKSIDATFSFAECASDFYYYWYPKEKLPAEKEAEEFAEFLKGTIKQEKINCKKRDGGGQGFIFTDANGIRYSSHLYPPEPATKPSCIYMDQYGKPHNDLGNISGKTHSKADMNFNPFMPRPFHDAKPTMSDNKSSSRPFGVNDFAETKSSHKYSSNFSTSPTKPTPSYAKPYLKETTASFSSANNYSRSNGTPKSPSFASSGSGSNKRQNYSYAAGF